MVGRIEEWVIPSVRVNFMKEPVFHAWNVIGRRAGKLLESDPFNYVRSHRNNYLVMSTKIALTHRAIQDLPETIQYTCMD